MALCINCLRREYDERLHEFCDECELEMGIVSREAYRKRKERKRRAAWIAPDPVRVARARGLFSPVKCIETGEVFASSADAARRLGVKYGTMLHAVKHGNAIGSTGHHYERTA